MMPRFARLFAATAFVLGASACTTHYIPNTDVEDTDDNRRLISFCEKYRHAVELKSVGTLLQMAAPTYYEDGGNVDASDDIDYAGLRDYLEHKFKDAHSIRYEIRYRRVVKEKERIYVDYTFSASFRIPGTKGDEWRRKVDDNRLELVASKDNDAYKIVAGM